MALLRGSISRPINTTKCIIISILVLRLIVIVGLVVFFIYVFSRRSCVNYMRDTIHDIESGNTEWAKTFETVVAKCCGTTIISTKDTNGCLRSYYENDTSTPSAVMPESTIDGNLNQDSNMPADKLDWPDDKPSQDSIMPAVVPESTNDVPNQDSIKPADKPESTNVDKLNQDASVPELSNIKIAEKIIYDPFSGPDSVSEKTLKNHESQTSNKDNEHEHEMWDAEYYQDPSAGERKRRNTWAEYI